MPRYRHSWTLPCLLLGAAAVAGCAEPAPDATSGADAAVEDLTAEEDAIRYNMARLADRDYVATYGDNENPRPWYTAAEALGAIGKPAIPALVQRLHIADDYELMLALYALMLASQDPVLQAETGGDYLRLGTVLTEDTNAENKRLALQWWARYRHLWR